MNRTEAFDTFGIRAFKIILMTIILAVLAVSAPAMAQYSLYQFREFSVTLEKYPPNKSTYTYAVINLEGTGHFRRTVKGEQFELDKMKDFKVTAQQLEYLYYQIMRNNFFEIGSTIGNPDIQEGQVVKVSVKIDNQQHTVTMFDERYLGVDMVINCILEVLPAECGKAFKDDYDGKSDKIDIKLE
jgi:hypothetical protein